MLLLRWIPAVGLALFVLEQVIDRRRIEPVRRRQRAWRATSKTLSVADRRAVGRAVRGGVAVTDPGLADAAVEMAGALTGQGSRRPIRWLSDLIFGGWLVTAVVVNGVRQDWFRMAVGVLGMLLFGAALVAGPGLRRRARAALVANRAVPRPRPPAAPGVPPPVDLGIGLPPSVARARRRTDTGPSR
ncbi:MAG: hypothetical protein QOG43_2358 [Actinomycetota bacterium]|nr:hypothetical protein [Actinomycetota bacterium]